MEGFEKIQFLEKRVTDLHNEVIASCHFRVDHIRTYFQSKVLREKTDFASKMLDRAEAQLKDMGDPEKDVAQLTFHREVELNAPVLDAHMRVSDYCSKLLKRCAFSRSSKKTKQPG